MFRYGERKFKESKFNVPDRVVEKNFYGVVELQSGKKTSSRILTHSAKHRHEAIGHFLGKKDSNERLAFVRSF